MNNILISPRTDPKKRGATSQTRPKQVNTPTSARKILSVPPSKCGLCEKRAFKPKNFNQFAPMVTKSLYVKYASSQNYYYTKDINEILADSHTPAVIKFKDFQCYDEDDEYLKRFYKDSEYNNKIQLLTEYYKFHWDIPRLFMQPTTEVLNRFHDKKRRLQYVRVTKMLKEQKESKNPQAKAPEDLNTKPVEAKPLPIKDRVLVDLETSYSILKTDDIKDYRKDKGDKIGLDSQKKGQKALEEGNIVEEFKIDTKRGNTSGVSKIRDEGNAQKKIQKKKTAEEQSKRKEASVSNTLRDLNVKLGEIISNAETTNLFERTEQSFDQSISNLKSFLNYLKSQPNSANTTVAQLAKETPKASTQQDHISSRPDSARKTLTRKTSTPKLEKQEEQNPQQTLPKSRGSFITWNRTESVPLVRPSPNMTRRESKATNEASKAEEKPKEVDPALLGSARILSAQSSLSSTSTSKSKSVYPSVTKIRNFEEAVKLGQQQSPSQQVQHKLIAPVDTTNSKQTSLQPSLAPANVAQGTITKEGRSSAEIPPRNIDLSIKIPQVHHDFNPQASPPASQVFSPKGSKSSSKLVKSTVPLTSRASEFKNLDSISPLGHSPHFRIKSHRESSFDKSQKDSNPPSSNNPKQVPLIQMTLSKNGHTRFASGGLIPQSTRASHGRSPTLTIQTGRDSKGLMPLDIRDIRMLPSSNSRREMMLMKGGDLKLDAVTGTVYKAVEGLIATDREKELTPLTPKMVPATHRDKLISHKHTRSEGGKLKADQLEALMGTINDQKIRELLRLNEGGATGLSDLINKSRKNGDSTAKNMGSYNMSNIVLSSHRDGNYDSAPVASSTQRKQSQHRIPGEMTVTPRNMKLEMGSSNKQKGQLKRMDSVGSDTKHKSGATGPERDEFKPAKSKTKLFG